MSNKKVLVAYFSCSGVTKRVAKNLADVLGADLFEIAPKIPYSNADLNWNDRNSRSSVEMRDSASRPEIAAKIADVDAYETVFVGFPIWWYTAPTIINAFLENNDFSGKTIVPFATSGGSGFGKTVESLKRSLPKNVVIQDGKLLNGSPSDEELIAWGRRLGLTQK